MVDGQWLGLLRLMWVIGAAVDLQLSELLATQAVLGKHPSYGPADGILGPFSQEGPVGPGPETTRVARVVVDVLVCGLGASQHDLVGVNDHHVVTGIDVGGKGRLVLTTQEGSDLRRHTSEDETLGVDNHCEWISFEGVLTKHINL